MRADLLLQGLPTPVRVLAVVGLLFVLGVSGSVAVAATKRLLASRHPVSTGSVGSAIALQGPGLKPGQRAAQRRPAAINQRSLARGVHPRAQRDPAQAPPLPPAELVPVVTAAESHPAEPTKAPSEPPMLPPLTHAMPPSVFPGEEEPPAQEEPPAGEPPAEEPPVEEPPAEEPPVEEPPAEEPPAEEPPAEEEPPQEPSPPPSFVGASIGDFWLMQGAPGAITEVADPAGGNATVFRFTVGDSDLTQSSTSNPRGELISRPNISAGAEFWWSTKFFLPSDFPASTPGFVNLLQGPFGSQAAGSPPFHIEANEGFLQWQRNATYRWDVPWKMPQVRNRWVTVLVHERFARDGFLELWIDGQQVTFFASGAGGFNPNGVVPTTRLEMATMDSSNDGGPNSLYLQNYRKRGMFAELTTYAGPLLIGPTRASVAG